METLYHSKGKLQLAGKKVIIGNIEIFLKSTKLTSAYERIRKISATRKITVQNAKCYKTFRSQ